MSGLVNIDCDRDGWYWYHPRAPRDDRPLTDADKSARARTYDEIIEHAKSAGYTVCNGGWKQKLLTWNWSNLSIDRYPGWAIEEGAPPWCSIRHVNGDTWKDGKRVSDEPATKSSGDVANAWDDVAEVQFYTRDLSYDGSFSVCNGEAYGSLWWFRTVAERERFLAWLPTFDPTIQIVYRCFAEFPAEVRRG